MGFEESFREWLDDCLEQQIPPGVRAFSFNLHEPAGEKGVKFGIELIGARIFRRERP